MAAFRRFRIPSTAVSFWFWAVKSPSRAPTRSASPDEVYYNLCDFCYFFLCSYCCATISTTTATISIAITISPIFTRPLTISIQSIATITITITVAIAIYDYDLRLRLLFLQVVLVLLTTTVGHYRHAPNVCSKLRGSGFRWETEQRPLDLRVLRREVYRMLAGSANFGEPKLQHQCLSHSACAFTPASGRSRTSI